jgi:hypothetical protein
MAFTLHGWAGDFTAEVPGRKPLEALVTISFTESDLPLALFESGDLDGTTWFYNIYVHCLTPGAPKFIVTAVDYSGDHYALTLLAWSFSGGEKKALKAGVHLFTVRCLSPGGNDSGTFATVLVPLKLKAPFQLSEAALGRMLEYAKRGGNGDNLKPVAAPGSRG